MRLLFWTLLLFVLWIVLSGSFSLFNLLVGVTVSAAVAFLYVKMFKHEHATFINPFWFVVYLYVLLKNLLLSNIQISKRILRPDMRLSPAIVAVKTTLAEDWKKLLLANSVTLTPGTLTLDVKGDTLFIHAIEFHEGEDKEDIIKEFETVIAKI